MDHSGAIITTTSSIRLRPDGIIEIRPNGIWDGEAQLEHARENTRVINQLADKGHRRLISFLPDYKVSEQAQKEYVDNPPNIEVAAMISKSMIQTLLGNLFIRFRKTRVPSRLFHNEEDAVRWLKRQGISPQKVAS